MAGDPFGLSGQVIESQFRVDNPIGEGGFSIVYKGMHLGLNEWVAIKCLKLNASLETDMIESFAKRFRDESRIAYRLSQGNLDIVRSITAGTTVAPTTGALVPYMVLEWLDGVSLARDLFDRRQRGMKGRTIEEIIELFDPAVHAIAYAHAQGVVHRDIKPGNLFLAHTRAGIRLKVLDFGLAKIIDDGIGIAPSVLTVGQQSIVCSPSYGAPEQFDASVGKIGPWTDVYALGLLLLETLRDQRVRTGEGLAQCALQALTPAFPMTCHALGIKVRPQVELALARAVAIDIGTRPADAAAFWDALKRAAVRSSPRSIPAAPIDAPLPEAATMWDPRGAAFDEAQKPPPSREPSRDPFMGTAMMLDAPSRPTAGTLPLSSSPTVPNPNVPLSGRMNTPPMRMPSSRPPAPVAPQLGPSPQSPFAASLNAPQRPAPAFVQPPPAPAHASAPPHAYAPPAPVHAYAPAPLPLQPAWSPSTPATQDAPVLPKSRAPLIIVVVIVGLVFLGILAAVVVLFVLRPH